MRRSTVVLFGALLLVVLGSVIWFQTHQHKLDMHVYHGGMSHEVKEKFFRQGIDCQEIYEVQGYESPESLLRMFGINQHIFYMLNPGQGMEFKQGTVVCVKGIWGITHNPISWFWPGVAAVAAVAGVAASLAVTHVAKKKTQQASSSTAGSTGTDAGV